jgi:uroporphyrinogen decarboxylase
MLFLNALSCNNDSGRIPVWLMRQAGRYMSSYRKLKESYSFHDLCLIPELTTQVTLQPIEAFDFDAAILFSDILLPLIAIGITTIFRDGKGPLLIGPGWERVLSPPDISSILQETISGVYQAAALLSASLDRPLIGFSGAPWTLAAYLIEGEASTTWPKTRAALQHNSKRVHALVRSLEEIVVSHLTLQIQAGVDAIQLFDSRSSLLPDLLFQEFSVQPILRIVRRLPTCPTIIYTANALTAALYAPSAISCDETVDMAALRSTIAPSVAIQGNLNPKFLIGPKSLLIQEIRHICGCMRNDKGFIFNLSSGVLPQTEEEAIHSLVETVREIQIL